jgi:flagellar protein FliS
MTSRALRARYLADSISTASPSRLLVMLYDRLLLDLSQGEAALRADDREVASNRLIHAQDIVLELRGSLNTTGWTGAAGLAQLYSFLLTELIRANVRREPDRVARCRELVQPLVEAWREAALGSEASPARVTPLRLAAGLG